MICNIAHTALTDDLKDLSQMIYMVLLEYDDEKIIDLYEHRQINSFLERIIVNQYRSAKSTFHYLFRKYRMIAEDITTAYGIAEED